MDLRRTVILVVALGGLVWALMTSPLVKGFWGGSAAGRPTPAPFQRVGVAQTTSPQTAPLSTAELAQWRQRYDRAWQRDPFFTAEEEQAMASSKPVLVQPTSAVPPAPLPSYTVKAIVISEAGKVAALNGRLVSEGERIGEERVVEIRPDGVVLERAGQRRRITLPGGATLITETDSRQKGARGGKP